MPTHTEQLQQNNPILYICLGNNCKGIGESIRNVQIEKIGLLGIAYINIAENENDNTLITLLKETHHTLMQKHYLYSGEIRVNYIVDALDESVLSLLTLREKIEGFLGFLYPVSILTDIYAFLDDKEAPLTENTQIAAKVLEMLESVSKDAVMIYLLSNIGRNIQNDEIQNSIYSVALLALVKDYVSLKTATHSHNLYNEDYFKKDTSNSNGRFMSIGYATIKKPLDVIKKILLNKLLTFMEKSHFDIDISFPEKKIIKNAAIHRLLDKDNLMGIGINTKQNLKNATTIEALAMLFDNRLNMYYELNISAEINYEQEAQELASFLNEISTRSDAGFFAIYALSAKSGKMHKMINDMIQANEEERKKLNNTYTLWENEVVKTNTSELQCYDLAKQYLEFKWEISRIDEIADYYQYLKEFISNYHQDLKIMKHQIDCWIDDNKNRIATLESAFPFIIHSFYESVLVEYLDTNHKEYERIYSQLYSFLKEGQLDIYIGILNDYIENTILNSELFNKPIIDETADILYFNKISKDGVHNYIVDWITQSKQFNIFLKTGEKHLHSEINILMSPHSKLIPDSVQKRQHINFFYTHSENEINILYHMGGFGKEELYYWELYNGIGGD